MLLHVLMPKCAAFCARARGDATAPQCPEPGKPPKVRGQEVPKLFKQSPISAKGYWLNTKV